ncbi:MAG TPA: response regulator [Gemmatimonadaceae bacterium]|nr:response regulator [Gemmatimonadaceae bacterium]
MTTPQAHVLLVEDSEAVAGAMRVLIESVGFRFTSADSVADAIARGTTDPAQLVLLDLTLPDGDGLSAIPLLRAAGCGQFVALTGHDDQATRQRCLDAGCLDVLVKPVPARELTRRLVSWL